MKKKLSWLKTSAGKIAIILFIIATLLISITFLAFFKQSSHFRDNFENILIGIGTNIVGIIITISFVQHIFDKQSEKKEKELEREKIIRFSQIMSFRIQKYFGVFAQVTTPIDVLSKETEKKWNQDFKFEDMKDLYFPCILISEMQKSAISVFYSEEKKIKEYMLRMLENIEFKYYTRIQQILLAFIKQSEAHDVSTAILNYENLRVGNKKMTESIAETIATNPANNWVEKIESGQLTSHLMTNFVILYRLLQNESFLLNEYISKIDQLSKNE